MTSPDDNNYQLLGVPSSTSGKGLDEAAVVYETLVEWNIAPHARCICCDTTPSNMGHMNGACVLLEEKLGRPLYVLACRKHMLELLPPAIFPKLFGVANGPDIALFKRFKSHWNTIDRNEYSSGLSDPDLKTFSLSIKDDMIFFIKVQFENAQRREDYEEMLLLTLILLDFDIREIPNLNKKVW